MLFVVPKESGEEGREGKGRGALHCLQCGLPSVPPPLFPFDVGKREQKGVYSEVDTTPPSLVPVKHCQTPCCTSAQEKLWVPLFQHSNVMLLGTCVRVQYTALSI